MSRLAPAEAASAEPARQQARDAACEGRRIGRQIAFLYVREIEQCAPRIRDEFLVLGAGRQIPDQLVARVDLQDGGRGGDGPARPTEKALHLEIGAGGGGRQNDRAIDQSPGRADLRYLLAQRLLERGDK